MLKPCVLPIAVARASGGGHVGGGGGYDGGRGGYGGGRGGYGGGW